MEVEEEEELKERADQEERPCLEAGNGEVEE